VQLVTPARFDILYAIYSTEDKYATSFWRFSASQADVVRRLGLHPTTVSKTVKRLIALKILRHRKSRLDDRRYRMLTFTPYGLTLFRRALQVVFDKPRHLATLLKQHVWRSKDPRSRRRWRLHAAVFALYSTVRALAYRLGDRADGLYHPHRNGTKDRQSPELAPYQGRLRKMHMYDGRRRPPRGPRTAPLSTPSLADASLADASLADASLADASLAAFDF
jgi:DNA-binding MarR family transcriptional regulator